MYSRSRMIKWKPNWLQILDTHCTDVGTSLRSGQLVQSLRYRPELAQTAHLSDKLFFSVFGHCGSILCPLPPNSLVFSSPQSRFSCFGIACECRTRHVHAIGYTVLENKTEALYFRSFLPALPWPASASNFGAKWRNLRTVLLPQVDAVECDFHATAVQPKGKVRLTLVIPDNFNVVWPVLLVCKPYHSSLWAALHLRGSLLCSFKFVCCQFPNMVHKRRISLTDDDITDNSKPGEPRGMHGGSSFRLCGNQLFAQNARYGSLPKNLQHW